MRGELARAYRRTPPQRPAVLTVEGVPCDVLEWLDVETDATPMWTVPVAEDADRRRTPEMYTGILPSSARCSGCQYALCLHPESGDIILAATLDPQGFPGAVSLYDPYDAEHETSLRALAAAQDMGQASPRRHQAGS